MPRLPLFFLICAVCTVAIAQSSTAPTQMQSAPVPPNYPAPVEGDFVIPDFHFRSGETLPELRIHYRTIGTPKLDGNGVVRNAVLIGHGTGGAGTQFLGPQFANVLFGPGGVLDASKYFIILADGIGHGGTSKPSDGLHARFPNYTYDDMVAAQHELLTKKLGVNHLRLVSGASGSIPGSCDAAHSTM